MRLFDTPLRCLDDVLGAVTLTRAGAGLVQTYHFVAQPDVSSGALVEVLPALRGATRPFYLLYPPNRYLATAVRAFVDFLLLPQA
ncbi:MAG: LysR substrate-binding domain-containing protein [Pseudomonadota bacterium]|nr:LysR substrate-binding domain-containing protein [Pseudomonadota bacterium]